MSDKPILLTAPPDGQLVQEVLAQLPWYHQLAKVWPDCQFVQPVVAQLPWYHRLAAKEAT